MPTSIFFDSLDMNDGTVYITQEIDHMSPYERNLPLFSLARANGAVVTDDTYGVKRIPHKGRIRGTSLADLESKIDTFNTKMSGFRKFLDIGYAGSTRRYIATAASAHAQPDTFSQWAEFDIEWLVTDFALDTSSTTLINAVANTTASYAPSLTIGGSAPVQPLVITIVVTAATGLASKTISVTNPAGVKLSVTRTWTVGDILIIDEQAMATGAQPVTVNGTAAGFTGYFPQLPPASGQVLTFDNDFTTRTLTYTISYTKRWK